MESCSLKWVLQVFVSNIKRKIGYDWLFFGIYFRLDENVEDNCGIFEKGTEFCKFFG